LTRQDNNKTDVEVGVDFFIPVASIKPVIFEPLSSIWLEKLQEGNISDSEWKGPYEQDDDEPVNQESLSIVLHFFFNLVHD